MGKRPNFFIIGVAKAGTTALYNQLQSHPAVHMSPVKEPSYFSEKQKPGGEAEMSLEQYENLFVDAELETAIGEASVSYLHSDRAPGALHKYCPEARIIVILRQPVLRAYSHYRMLLNSGVTEYATFAEASSAAIHHVQRNEAIPFGTGYRQSFYAKALQRYVDLFPDQMLVLKYHRYLQSPGQTFRDVLTFLDIDTSYIPDTLSKKYNEGSGAPRSLVFQKLLFSQSGLKRALKKLIPNTLKQKIKKMAFRLNQADRKRLDRGDAINYTRVFHDDIRKTEVLTGVDLSDWKRLPYLDG